MGLKLTGSGRLHLHMIFSPILGALLIALAAFGGWRALSGSIPMNANAMAAFFALGTCLCVRYTRLRFLTVPLSLSVASYAFAVLCQYIFDWNLGIDEWIRAADPKSIAPHPGRMATDTAYCLFVLSTIFIFDHYYPRSRMFRAIAAAAGAAIGGLAAIRILSETSILPSQFVLGSMARMSVYSASIFLGLSVILTVRYFARYAQPKSRSNRSRHSVYSLTAAGMLVAIFFWQAMLAAETEQLKFETKAAAERNILEIRSALSERLASLSRMAHRAGYSHALGRSDWENDAANYLSNFAGLREISLRENRRYSGWTYPRTARAALLQNDSCISREKREVTRRSLASDLPELTPLCESEDQSVLFAIAVPFGAGAPSKGVLIATVDAGDFLRSVLHKTDHQVTISQNQKILFATFLDTEGYRKRWSSRVEMGFGPGALTIEATPDRSTLRKQHSSIAVVLLLVVSVMAMLFGLTLEFAHRARAHSRRLRASEERFSAFMENSPALTWAKTAEGGYVFANHAFEVAFGKKRADLIGKTPEFILNDEDVRRAGREHDLEVLRTKQPRTQLQLVPYPDGTLHHLQIYKFPIVLQNDETILGAIAFDVTERIQAEQRLIESTRMLEDLIQSSPLPILTLDLQGKLTLWNAACERTFGWTADEVLGKPLPFVPDGSRDDSSEIIEKITKLKLPLHVERERRRKDGSKIYVSIDARGIFDGSGRSTGAIAILGDISEQKEIARVNEEARINAINAAELKSRFLASVSHEIRTPLNGVIGMTDLLSETVLNEEQCKYVEVIRNSGSNLLALINDLLDLSKIEAGQMRLEETRFDLARLVESQTEILLGKAHEKSLSLVTYISPDLPREVVGDPSRVGQVLLNLISNGVKFTQKGGVSIRVTPSPTEADQSKDFIYVRFEVQDTGIGIAKSALGNLFKPFSQADSSTHRRFGGTGLGLSISKHLVDSMHGDIGIESTEGVGTTFSFTLRFGIAAVKESPTPSTRSTTSPIILIEPDSIVSEMLARYLASWGMHFTVHATLDTALKEFSELTSDALSEPIVFVSDAAMTDANFTAEARRFKGARFIRMSEFHGALSHPEIGEPIWETSLTKPIRQSSLYDAIMQVNRKTLEPVASASTMKPLVSSELRSPFRILIADDVEVNQMLAQKILEKLGYAAVCAKDGKEALDLVTTERFDLILMDCQMPVLDGFEATRAIRAHADPKVRGIPIIALTANAMAGDEERCLSSGMNGYLSKPLRRDKLADTLHRWLDSRADARRAG